MATRKDASRGLRPYQAHRREEWLHDLKLELRSKSRFAWPQAGRAMLAQAPAQEND